jgi:hypothetical protein
MTIPGFTSDASLYRSSERYRTQISRGTITLTLGTVQPQLENLPCWCSEPDVRRVCTRSGCYWKHVCLQISCPSRSGEIDPGDLFPYSP